jgi:primosomal protein N' (replication factor Y)
MSYQNWQCSWCQSQRSFLLGRGADRFALEIGRAFPGQGITQSGGDKMVDDVQGSNGIVVATPGAIPVAPNGYAAIVVLECDRLFSQIDLRATERAREVIFNAGGLLAAGGDIFLVISRGHPILSALSSWKPSLITRKELHEREEIGFPPFVRALTLDIESSEATSLLRALKSAQQTQRLPSTTRILGPSQLTTGTSRFLLLSPLNEGESLISLIHEFQRKRSASKKRMTIIRIDPYSLTS